MYGMTQDERGEEDEGDRNGVSPLRLTEALDAITNNHFFFFCSSFVRFFGPFSDTKVGKRERQKQQENPKEITFCFFPSFCFTFRFGSANVIQRRGELEVV